MTFKKFIYTLSAGALALTMLGSMSIATAATGFVEDFSGGSLPSHLEAVGGVGSQVSPGTSCCGGEVGGGAFENGKVRFKGRDTRGDKSGGLRSYLRTIEADYNSVSFVAEVTATVPAAFGSPNKGRNIVFFGLGPVLPLDIYGGPSRQPGNDIGLLILPLNFAPRFRVGNAIINHDDLSCGGNGTHRMRLEWNAQTKTAITSIDQDYTGGPFSADCTLPPITSFPDENQLTNGRIYIGGDWDAIFDDLQVELVVETDTDGDGVPDSTDFCPTDATNDADDDGICGGVDNCPAVANTDQADTDGDGVGDACNEGDDNDGDDWNNELDNCPAIENPTQADADLDGTGDACDSCPIDAANDADGDGVCGDIDNCPVTANSGQTDTDGDFTGDACDDDDDNDGTLDGVDNCPLTANDQADFDNDGQGEACDDDVDGDNVNDADDACLNTAVGALVNSKGCAVAQLCPCDGNWKNHGAFVKCVAHTANDFRDAGLISDSEHGEIVSAAAQSSCGSKK